LRQIYEIQNKRGVKFRETRDWHREMTNIFFNFMTRAPTKIYSRKHARLAGKQEHEKNYVLNADHTKKYNI
jgi:hypothetical protein